MKEQQGLAQLNVKIPAQLKTDLGIHSAKTNISIKEIVERAIADYLAWNDQN